MKHENIKFYGEKAVYGTPHVKCCNCGHQIRKELWESWRKYTARPFGRIPISFDENGKTERSY